MEGLGRKYLNGSIMLSRSADGSSPEEYFIKSVIGEGGSTVCYEATRILKDGIIETGKLKEFYPMDSVVGNKGWYYSLERLPNGQLVFGEGEVRKFDEMCQDYLNTYKLLRNVMVENPKNEILKGYIQIGEILYGSIQTKSNEREKSLDNRRTTVYIWSPGVAGKGFDVYLSEVKKNPTKNPEARLYDILCVMDALTDCIKAIHTAGLLHLDIKPSNFLVQYDSDFQIKPNNISLFDINTLCSINSEFLKVSGTEGYCAPEVLRCKADNRSDIYSLGVMLFQALVITNEISDGLYRDYYYSSIAQLVKYSALFQASEINSDMSLMSRLCKILEKCLAKNPRERYQSCSELRKDLNIAMERLETMLHAPVEKSRKGLIEPTVVIQKLLYEHPLYETVGHNQSDINVLVIGFDIYGQKFIDLCLQLGQMLGIHLNIVTVSDESEEDREAYLRFRPAISEFVNINNSFKGKEDLAYATLEFKGVSEIQNDENSILRFTNKMSQSNKDIVKHLHQQAIDTKKEYDYIFVSLGNDLLNKSIAQLCVEEMKHSCSVCYISQKLRKVCKTHNSNRLYPVCINESVDVAMFEQSLGEMAFNAYISWNDTMNMDVIKERENFFKGESENSKYYRKISLAFVLSIKYKLHSVSIECEDLLKAGILFSKQILETRVSDAAAKKKFDQLVDLEHRRWLIEKAVEGWTVESDSNSYKEKDEVLIEKIPFILTYRYKPTIAMAFEDGKYENGRSEAVFANVASITVLSPQKILFLYCYNKDSKLDLFIRKLDATLYYLCKRNIRSEVELMVVCRKDISEKERICLLKELMELKKVYQVSNGTAWFEKETIYDVETYTDAVSKFTEYLKENSVDLYDGGTQLFPFVYDNAMFISQIIDMKLPYFEFDWRNKVFSKRIGCEYLQFIKDTSFIRIGDMFALMNAKCNRFDLPEFEDDCEALWKIYTGEYLRFKKFENGVNNWNRLCRYLEKYEADQKPLAKLPIHINAMVSYKALTYFLPIYTFTTVKMLVQKLMEYGIAGEKTNLVNYTSDTCKLEIWVKEEHEQALNTVLANAQILLPYYEFEVSRYKDYYFDYVEIRCNRLDVNGINLDPEGNGSGAFVYDVLYQLQEACFITQLNGDRSHPTDVKFVYSSPRIKKLLTSAGEILKVYAYYDVLKTGYFDDVAIGYEFNWESGDVKDELDLVLTKGFKSMIVECKAVEELKLEYYHKLHIIADQFGIGTTKVLIGNTYETSNAIINDLNKIGRSRGSQLGIETISSEDKIVNIGQTLMQLMEKNI